MDEPRESGPSSIAITVDGRDARGPVYGPSGPFYQNLGPTTIYAQAGRSHEPPRMVPPTPDPDRFVQRGKPQEQLASALEAADGPRLIHLYGASGVGKTTLAAVEASRALDRYPDGVLWESVETYQEPDDLLLRFLGALDPAWYQSAPPARKMLREAFWDQVAGKRLLIVLDNVAANDSLLQLLPAQKALPPGACLLVIGYHRLRFPDGAGPVTQIALDGLERERDVELLLGALLGSNYVRLHRVALLDLARFVDNNPLQLISVGRELASGHTTPERFLRALQSNERSAAGPGRGLELSIRDLEPAVRDVFALMGAFGASSWRPETLAAACMCSLAALGRPLDELRERGLVQQHADGRLYLNLQARQIARELFEQRDRYYQDAALTGLARHLLDLAQDTARGLLASPELHGISGQAAHPYDIAFVGAFQAAMLTELPHLRRVFEWAQEREDWALLLRFADVAHVALLKAFTASGFESYFPLTMATVVEPLVAPRGERQRASFDALIGAAEWSWEGDGQHHEQAGGHAISRNAPPGPHHLPELCLSITIGAVIDGTFEEARLVDTRWVGVRAPGLILKRCALNGARFLGCDLSNAMWDGGEAQQCDLTGSSLAYALIKDVELHRAVLRNASLRGAIIEGARLRGADLTGADLTGAVLTGVNLRGADLRGANLTLARLERVRLDGARLEDVRWHGATIDPSCRFSDQAARAEAERCAAEPPPPDAARVRPRPRIHEHNLVDQQGREFPLADLRAVTLDGRVFSPNPSEAYELNGVDMRGADLRGAQLTTVLFRDSDLENITMRAARLTRCVLRRCNLRGADLRASIFQEVSLEDSELTRALLRGSDMRGVRLAGAALINANLRGVDLSGANLTGAQLVDIDLQEARLRESVLEGADLSGANLSAADLTGARLRGAVLANTRLAGADLRGADYELAQLAAAAWRAGLRLSDGPVLLLDKKLKGAHAIGPELNLRLAHLRGEFHELQLDGRDLSGAELAGTFRRVMLRGARLAHARLTGRLIGVHLHESDLSGAVIRGVASRVRLDGATLRDAVIDGILSTCSFRGADLSGARLDNASLVGCDFTGAVVGEGQLRTAARLRGVTLPDGSRYLGQLALAGDQADAARLGIQPADMLELFYLPEQVVAAGDAGPATP